MRIGLNKRKSSIVLREYGGRPGGKSVTVYLGSIQVVPEVPRCAPDKVRARLTPLQLIQVDQWLDDYRNRKPSEEETARLRRVIPDGLAAIFRIVDAVTSGAVEPSPDEMGTILADLSTAYNLLQQSFGCGSPLPAVVADD